MGAWRRIEERVEDRRTQRRLLLLSRVIRVTFRGHVPREVDLTEYMSRTFGWSNRTTRAMLVVLERIGVVTCHRADHNRWTKVYELTAGAGP